MEGGKIVGKLPRQLAQYVISRLAAYPPNVLLYGKNAKGHLIKHADVLGFGSHTPQQLQKMLPQLKAALEELLKNADPNLTRVGRWHGHLGAKMYISNGKMIVIEADDTFITMINKTSNAWYLKAVKP